MNVSIKAQKYIDFKNYMKSVGWDCWESKRWTRKGYGNQKNSNIDIVMTHLIDK